MKTLALSMIVRDAADTLPQCLTSVRDCVDEILVADTGSADGTAALAQKFGARVISIPWTNDFSAARNRALAEVQSDWILVLDADEVLNPGSRSLIRGLLQHSSAGGYQVTIRNYVLSLHDRVWDRPAVPNDSTLPAARSFPAYVEHQNVRLFRHDAEIYFVGRVHESVGPRLVELHREILTAPFSIHHFGLAASAETRARKNAFYRELGRQKIREMPENAQAHLELGLVELDNFANLSEARALFERACQLDPRFGVAWFFLGIVHLRENRFGDALPCFSEAEHNGHRTALVKESQGDAHYNSASFGEASRCYETAFRRDASNPMIESKLGLALLRSGNPLRGQRHLRHALELLPSAPELHDRLITALVWLDKIDQAALAAETKLGSIAAPSVTDFTRAASLWAKLEDWPRALAMLQVGVQAFPENKDLLKALHQLSRELGISNPVPS